MARAFKAVLTVICILAASPAPADTGGITSDDLRAWILDSQPLEAELRPGTTITAENIDRLDPVLPPGYRDLFRFPEVAIEIQETGDYRPFTQYREATEKYGNETSLNQDHSLSGHTAGQPFSDARIATANPVDAAYMIAWNNIYRWHYYGYEAQKITMFYLRPGDPALAGDHNSNLHGGGKVERSVDMSFHRVYLSRLAMLPAQDFRVDVSDSKQLYYKDYMELFAPFDVAGSKFIIERSLDPDEEDQVNSYLASERRVRRLSAQERADNFMGADVNFDDFEGFSGRVLDYSWTLIGEKRILTVADSKHATPQLFGPGSNTPNDRWQLRDYYVVAIVPKWKQHPYRIKFMFVDKQTWLIGLALIFNREDQIWKILDPIYQYPEADQIAQKPQASVGRWMGTVAIDLNDRKSTVSVSYGTDIPTMLPKQVRRVFRVSNLNEGR